MNFSDFISKIDQYKTTKLGGIVSQFKLAPKLRKGFSEEQIIKNNPKKAAVLVLFYPDKYNRTCFVLTQRASYKGPHSAQISFTGGKQEERENLEQTALRETFEEIGVPSSDVKIIRQITENYIPPSNFLVTPFLGYTHKKPDFIPNYEVGKIIEVLLNTLLDDDNISSTAIETSYMSRIKTPCFIFDNQIVWGATAMILSEIRDLIKEVN